MTLVLKTLLVALFVTFVFAGYSAPYSIPNDNYYKDTGSRRGSYDAKDANYYEDGNEYLNEDLYAKDAEAAKKDSSNKYHTKDERADNLYQQKNTHANEIDDLDKYDNRVKFDKTRENLDDFYKNTKYQDHVDDEKLNDYENVNKLSESQKQRDLSGEDSAAEHYETTDVQNHDVGVGYGVGYDDSGSGAKHGSSKKHSQGHAFKNSAKRDWINDYDVDALNALKNKDFIRKKRGVAFEDTKAANNKNKEAVYYDNANSVVKQRRGKNYDDNFVDTRNVYANKKVDKEDYADDEYRRETVANKNKDANVNHKKASNSYLNHAYEDNDYLGKNIGRNGGYGSSYKPGFGYH